MMRAARGCALVALLPLSVAQARTVVSTRASGHDCVAPAARPQRGPWPQPLGRVVSLDLGETSLRGALDRIAADSRVRLAYSPDLLPLDRRVCLAIRGSPLGDVLVSLLAGSGVAPVIIGSDQVVLAPNRVAAGADATPLLSRGAARLDRVVVTGTATGGSERASPFALTVLEGAQLANAGTSSLASAFAGAVPGIWMWAPSPTNPLARYGSVRGASSLGVSTPKVYVDGIEAANPLMIARLDPSQIERIEVIRGPQGSALYGSDAISGVVQIVTRHAGADPDAPTTLLRVSAGSSSSDYAERGVLSQEHGLTIRSGSDARSASAGVSLSTLGAFAPGADARQLLATAAVRHVGARVIVTGTARFDGTNADVPASPVLRGLLIGQAGRGDSTPQRVRQYTVGGTATLQSSERWTHAVTAGVDGYRLSGVSADGMPLPSATDSALRAARGGADRATLRYSGTRRFADPERQGASLTVGVDHSTARENSSGLGEQLAPRPRGSGPGDSLFARLGSATTQGDVTWWSNTGLLTQAQVAVQGSLFISGGLRLEQIAGPAASTQAALLPMLGASWVAERGPLVVKLRAAFGRGIRPARTVSRGATWMGGRREETLLSLDPEEQAGVEAGIDAIWSNAFQLHVTRFDQTASGLVQPVALLESNGSSGPGGSGRRPRVVYQLQNIGAIDNGGWELQGSTARGALTLGATATLVSSRVARLASGYRGDLRRADRMLEVPSRTFGVNAAWNRPRWSASGSVARAADWINYDKLSLATALSADATGTLVPVGPALRAYWREYPGTTHLSARLSLAVLRHSWVHLSGDNLLDRQIGEPDNVTVVPGRTVRLGIATGF